MLNIDDTLAIESALSLFDVTDFAGNLSSVTATGAYSGAFNFNAGNSTWNVGFGDRAMTLDLNTGGLIVAVPEPSTALLILGTGALALLRRRSRRARS